MKVDIVLLTKNSLKPCLKECLDSIYLNVPVNRLLVVDGGSTDETLNLVRKYPRVEVIDDSKGNRATSRQKGIEAAETKWHLHVDSDVILCRDWFKKAWKHVDEKVGAVWGVAIPKEPHTCNIVKAMAKLYRTDLRDLLITQFHLKRYLMHDTLIRTEVVKDIRIPSNLHIWEDHYIGKHVVSMNYKWIKTKEPYCLHFVHDRRAFNDFVESGMLAKMINAYATHQVLLRLFLALPKSFWIFLVTGDVKASKLQLEKYIGLVKGWFGG